MEKENKVDLMAEVKHFKPRDTTIKTHQYKDTKIYKANNNFATQNLSTYLEQNLSKYEKQYGEISNIIILNKKDMNAAGGYDRKNNYLYLASEIGDPTKLEEILKSKYYASTSLEDILHHEFAHKLHRSSIERFYNDNKTLYNSIEEAAYDFNNPIREFVKTQLQNDLMYLKRNISNYADYYYFEKSDIYEFVAELFVKKNNRTIGSAELKLIEEVFGL